MTRFVKQRITIYARNEMSTKKVELQVEAMVAAGTGLAYHPYLYKKQKPGYTSITHIASGMQVGNEFPDDDEFAQRFIERLCKLIDWNRLGEEIQKKITKAMLEEMQEKLVFVPVQETLF